MLFSIIDTLASHLVTRYLIISVVRKLLNACSRRAIEKHEYHTLQVDGIILHHGADFVQIFLLERILVSLTLSA